MEGRKPNQFKSYFSRWREVRFFRSIRDTAKELGFSKHRVGRAYHNGRNRIGQYE